MAAAMSTADGLILAIANAISHDVYYKMIDPKAETAKRLLVARVLLVVIGFAGATIAAMEIQGILGSVIWAFDFAMSGLFFPLVLGVWWKRANRQGAVAGMILGLWFCYLVPSLGTNWWKWILGSYSVNIWYLRSWCEFNSYGGCKFNDC